MTRTVFGSLARIADLDSRPFDIMLQKQAAWATGDYVVAEVTATPSDMNLVEDRVGEMVRVKPGDRVVGALGCRAATLEGVGSWRDVRDGQMQMLTGAGLLGVFTSYSVFLPEPASLRYQGHVARNGRTIKMTDFALQCDEGKYAVPTILLIGTSMSAGKTTTGRLACKILSEAGIRVIAVKLTGAGRYRDILSLKNAGAAEVFDFVDVGLPSTVVSEDIFRAAIRPLLRHIAAQQPDVVVVEAGASPLEPYNGAAAVDELNDNIRCTILCASDPYAVVGVQMAFDFTPDLVAGPATNTSAAIDLVEKLSGLRGINVVDPNSVDEFRDVLSTTLNMNLD
jgi:hypothetical protein